MIYLHKVTKIVFFPRSHYKKPGNIASCDITLCYTDPTAVFTEPQWAD